ncbi:MAG: HAD-IA family hydrolase [Candidatus Thermoplasmatota archaeon]
MEYYNGKFNSIFFDLGGTLISLNSLFSSMLTTLQRYLNNKEKLDMVVKWAQITYELLNEVRYKQFLSIKKNHKEALGETLKIYNITLTESEIDSIVYNVWKDFSENYELFPDVQPVLTELKKKGYKLGIITDADIDVVENILQQPALKGFFDAVVISERLQTYKPNPSLFKKGIDLIKCKPEEAVYVGDSEKDIAGAKKIGLKTVVIKRDEMFHEPATNVEPDFVLNSLSELFDVLSKINKDGL